MEAIHFSDTVRQVLVTGGTGFIGQLLIRALIADEQQVTVLTRDPKKAAWLFDGKVRCIASMDELPSSQVIDVMINLAGARILGWRWSDKRKQVLLQSRVGVTQKLVNWIAQAEHKPKLLLSGSAIGYYGIQPKGDATALNENNPPQPIFMSRLCQKWEAAAEQAGDYGVKVVCMRFGLVMGHQGALPMMMLPIKLGLGGPLGDGRQWLSWIHVEDLLRAIAFLWKRHFNDQDLTAQAYNFTAPESVTHGQFSKVAAQVVHRPCFLPTPALPMQLMLGEQSDLLLQGQRVVPEKLEREGFRFRYASLRAALQDLY
ncbi:MAG: TIGR01777 family oxidoreductase [Burkholderiaceae bacterium]